MEKSKLLKAADELMKYAVAGSWDGVQTVFGTVSGDDPFGDTFALMQHWVKDPRLAGWRFEADSVEESKFGPKAGNAAHLAGAALNGLMNGDLQGARLIWGLPASSTDKSTTLFIERTIPEVSNATGMALLMLSQVIQHHDRLYGEPE